MNTENTKEVKTNDATASELKRLLFDEVSGQRIIDECDVIDIHGNHCPEMPVHSFERNDETVFLCDRCYTNYKNGAYEGK